MTAWYCVICIHQMHILYNTIGMQRFNTKPNWATFQYFYRNFYPRSFANKQMVRGKIGRLFVDFTCEPVWNYMATLKSFAMAWGLVLWMQSSGSMEVLWLGNFLFLKSPIFRRKIAKFEGKLEKKMKKVLQSGRKWWSVRHMSVSRTFVIQMCLCIYLCSCPQLEKSNIVRWIFFATWIQ